MAPSCEDKAPSAAMAAAASPASSAPATLTLRGRLARAVSEFSSQIAEAGGGALVQIWMPERLGNGDMVLSSQGLPFAVVGVREDSSLLALFRCVSVRYRFSTDVHKPALMGCVGRVFSSMEPEMSHDVQRYNRNVYLRVSEAQRCRVHSTLVVPVFMQHEPQSPAAILELVQNDKDCVFPEIMSSLSQCLEAVQLRTCSLDRYLCDLNMRLGGGSSSANRLEGHGDAAALMVTCSQGDGSLALSQGQRLVPLPSEDAGENHIDSRSVQRAKRQSSTDANTAASTLHARSNPLPAAAAAAPQDGALDSVSLSCMPAAALSAGEAEAGTMQDADTGNVAAAQDAANHASARPAAVSVSKAPPPQQQQEQQQSHARPNKVKGGLSRQLGSSQAAASPADTCGASSPPPQALLSWMTSNGISPEALEALKALLNQASAACKGGAAGAEQAPGPKQKQQRQEESPPPALSPSPPTVAAQPQQVPLSGSQSNKRHWSSSTESPPAKGTVLVGSEGSAGLPLATAPSGQLQQYMQQYQSEPGIGAHPTLAVHLVDDGGERDGDADVDGGDDDVGSSSGGEDDGEEGGGSPRHGQGGSGRPQRIGTGAGRRLKYEDLQTQFGKGLKEAAANLGICATTLKRACRRHGIKRWPRRQIAKLSRTLTQMGFQGAPPALLVESAVKGQLAGVPAVAGAAKPPKRQASSKALQQQQQQQQQVMMAMQAQPMCDYSQLQAQMGVDMRHVSMMPHMHGYPATPTPFANFGPPAGPPMQGAWPPQMPGMGFLPPGVSMGMDSGIGTETCVDPMMWHAHAPGAPAPGAEAGEGGAHPMSIEAMQYPFPEASGDAAHAFSQPQPSCSGTTMGLLNELLGKPEHNSVAL